MKSLPERVATIEERTQNNAAKLDKIEERVDEIYALIQRGKGAKWVIVTFASAISGFVGIIAHKYLPF